jgi:signal transduction histidine kinase
VAVQIPIQARLTLVSAVLMAGVIAALGWFLVARLEADLTAALDDRLRDHAAVVAPLADMSGGLGDVILGDPGDAFAQVLRPDGSILSATAGLSVPVIPRQDLETTNERFLTTTVQTAEEAVPARLLVTPRDGGGLLVVGVSIEDERDALGRLAGLLWLAGPIAVALASAVGWLVAGAALRPVERLRREAEAVSASEPGRRLPVPATRDELSRLADSLNGMLDRLEDAAERERRFVATASHELRTPLANLRAELDLALRKGRSREDLELAVESATEETERLIRLAEDLLVLARAGGAAGLPLRREDVAIGEIVSDTVAGFGSRARESDVELLVDLIATPTVRADPVRIRQAVGNLLENALRHTPRGGTVTVRVSEARDGVAVSVDDSGPGIGTAGGSGDGLGLSIVRAIAEAHGGGVWIGEADLGGARVTIHLPR